MKKIFLFILNIFLLKMIIKKLFISLILRKISLPRYGERHKKVSKKQIKLMLII